jgi:CBS domain containing-hemolysin-like protein
MVAEGLPLVLNRILPSRAPWVPYLISTTAIALFGEIMPQAIMPLYILEIGGRTMWFLKCVMWILAIPACIPAYGLRRFRRWRERDQPEKADGIMEADEILEFIRLHEQSKCYGGPLTDECGTMVRALISGQQRMVGQVVRPLQEQDIVHQHIERSVSDLLLHHVPIVQANCSTQNLISLLTRTRHP